MRRLSALVALAAMLMLAGCDRRTDNGPVVVSAIGAVPQILDPARQPLDAASRQLMDAVAQGLVRFDANGQIEPGLAERWIVIDDGMSYIFRLRDAEWSDGEKVTAEQVIALLRREIGRGSHNPLAPYLTAIDEIVEMTPEVIEIRLKRPRPDLLKLFAQPELAIFQLRPARGSGPFRIAHRAGASVMLRPSFDPARVAAEDVEEPGPEQNVQLIGERAARAITRFTARESDMVVGGTFADWPLLNLAGLAPANLHTDPAQGLFGLAIVNRDGFLGDVQNRAALAQAIDRDAIVAAYAPGWTATDQLLPDQLDSAAPPARPDWATLARAARYSGARERVARWRADHDEVPSLRIALPRGPGATILYGFIGASLRSIGIEPVRVGMGDAADLRLIDAVAPYDSARWYLATACQPCSDRATEILQGARDADSLAMRGQLIAEADAAIAQDHAFIPIARPLRWSLVALRLGQWQENPRAWHPLNRLRRDTN